jgi:hypothetical protein
VLAPGDSVPDVRVWTAPGEPPRSLGDVLGGGLALLCFYLFDWSAVLTHVSNRRTFSA